MPPAKTQLIFPEMVHLPADFIQGLPVLKKQKGIIRLPKDKSVMQQAELAKL